MQTESIYNNEVVGKYYSSALDSNDNPHISNNKTDATFKHMFKITYSTDPVDPNAVNCTDSSKT